MFRVDLQSESGGVFGDLNFFLIVRGEYAEDTPPGYTLIMAGLQKQTLDKSTRYPRSPSHAQVTR